MQECCYSAHSFVQHAHACRMAIGNVNVVFVWHCLCCYGALLTYMRLVVRPFALILDNVFAFSVQPQCSNTMPETTLPIPFVLVTILVGHHTLA